MQRRAPARNQHWAESVTRRQRVLNIATWIAAVVTLFFGIMQIVTGPKILALGLVNVGTAIAFMLIPLLHRFGDVIASLTFVTVAFASLTASAIATVPRKGYRLAVAAAPWSGGSPTRWSWSPAPRCSCPTGWWFPAGW